MMLSILWRSAWRAGVVILLMAGGTAFASNEPPFYIGGHDDLAIVGSPQVDSAMRRIVMAANDEERNAALAAAQKLADAGDATAAFRLARYYHLETSRPNYALARTLYAQALARGNPWAANNIGLLYRDGAGVQQDYAKAREYFEKGAAGGSPLAYYNLELLSLRGGDGPSDVPAALEWLNKGAARGIALCLYEEAALYYTGAYGVPQDLAKAMTLGARAAELGDRSAAWGIAKLYLLGEGVPLDPAKGMELLRTLSQQGYGRATDSLGQLYADDHTRNEFFGGSIQGVSRVPEEVKAAVPQDINKALGYWELSARQGECHALVVLASVYDRGAGVPLDYAKGAKYMRDAVRCAPTDPFYLWKLGDRLSEGRGLPRDCVAASKLFIESVALGYSDAAVNLGYIYDKGCDSIPRDDKRALQIYLAGAKAGVPLCQNNVGAMLKHGRGISAPDKVRAYAWLIVAANNGNPLAVQNLIDYHNMFPEDLRRQGLEHLEEVKKMIHPGRVDLNLLASGDMSY